MASTTPAYSEISLSLVCSYKESLLTAHTNWTGMIFGLCHCLYCCAAWINAFCAARKGPTRSGQLSVWGNMRSFQRELCAGCAALKRFSPIITGQERSGGTLDKARLLFSVVPQVWDPSVSSERKSMAMGWAIVMVVTPFAPLDCVMCALLSFVSLRLDSGWS